MRSARDAAPAADPGRISPSAADQRRSYGRSVARRAAGLPADLVSHSPGSFVYLLVLAVTIWLLSSLDSHTTDVLLRSVSTNVVQMSRSAPRVLVLSAFVASTGNVLVFILQFSLVHVPAERWLGTRRWLAVIVAGHVGASTITTVGIWLLLRTGHQDRALVYPIDVGVSYTLAAAAAALTYRWQLPVRVVWLIGLAAWFRVDRLLTSPTFTDIGHACAFAIGLAVTPLLLPTSTDALRLSVPKSGSPRSWRRYISSVAPRRTRGAVHRWMPVAAAAAILIGVGFGVMAHVSATSTSDSIVSVPAEVVAIERSCAAGCPRLRLEYRYDGALREATVPTPARSNARVGATRLVQFHVDRPGQVTIGRNTENIDAGGFFSLAAIASFVAALLLALGARRLRSGSGRVRTNAGTHPAVEETGDASDAG